MEVNALKAGDTAIHSSSSRSSMAGAQNTVKVESDSSEKASLRSEIKGLEKEKQINKSELRELTEEMSRFMQLLNANLQFAVHEKTQRLMVQVIDVKEQKVLREFPSHEFLDTVAKIQDYVGFLLDKKA